jgi:hypothetical protein
MLLSSGKKEAKWIGFQSFSTLKMEAESSFQNIEFYNLHDELSPKEQFYTARTCRK